jgi:cellulose synthase/poly-beta-1,6-N-acetylglucosamine synthase-like glycosyltransferase
MIAAWIVLACVAVPTLVFAIETMAGLRPLPMPDLSADPGEVVVVVPAHDEEAGIAATLAGLAGMRLLVVADNCRDATADVARRAGAETIERIDPAARGKGHALAFARDHLDAAPPRTVIVIDADCSATHDDIDRLARAAATAGRPVQASYLLRPRADAGAIAEVSGFAFLVKNLIRQRGLARIGAPAILTGSGMAFPWPVFAAAPLATGDTVEDLVIGIALSRMGHAPHFLDRVTIWSDPSSSGGTFEQRRRWEQGFLATARRQAPSLIASGRPALIWLGLHLLVPPLALLVLIQLVAVLMLAVLSKAAALAAIALTGLTAAVVLAAWLAEGRDQMRMRTLIRLPFYIAWKLPIYAGVLLGRERRWTRTRRD